MYVKMQTYLSAPKMAAILVKWVLSFTLWHQHCRTTSAL